MVDVKEKKLSDLTDEEFGELIRKEFKLNSVEVNGVLVHSSVESLKKCEECVNRLVKKHQNFLLMKKEIAMKTGYTG